MNNRLNPPTEPRLDRALRNCAFTRFDLLVTLGVLTLLAFVVLPALANQRPRSARVICANNLRQIGVAFQLWGNDHADRLPQETPVSEGGTMVSALAPNVWLHLSWISNEVATPTVFLCPSDNRQAARDFSGSPDGGYIHPNFRNRASTYFLGYTGVSNPYVPEAVVAGDRNLTTEGASSCSRFGTAQTVTTSPFSSGPRWTNALHGEVGNVLSFDGRVRQLDSPSLREALNPMAEDTGNKHIIVPR